jgi:hypothetical protein
MTNKRKMKLSFKEVVESTQAIATCYRNGLQALAKHSAKVKLGDTVKCTGSVDLDTCVTQAHPQANRWDYFFCYKGEVFFVEVHSAQTGEVSTVLRKLAWLRTWLNTTGQEINKMRATSTGPYFWVQSNGFHIPLNSPQYRQASQNGIKPVAVVSLP